MLCKPDGASIATAVPTEISNAQAAILRPVGDLYTVGATSIAELK